LSGAAETPSKIPGGLQFGAEKVSNPGGVEEVPWKEGQTGRVVRTMHFFWL